MKGIRFPALSSFFSDLTGSDADMTGIHKLYTLQGGAYGARVIVPAKARSFSQLSTSEATSVFAVKVISVFRFTAKEYR